MPQKSVNVSIEEAMPLAQDVIELIVKKQENGLTPKNVALAIAAVKLAERFFLEEAERLGGEVAMGSQPSGH